VNVVAIRFGNQSPIVSKMIEVLGALKAAIPDEDSPLSKESKEEMGAGMNRLHQVNASFLTESKKALEDY
jgi:hypothetical protein